MDLYPTVKYYKKYKKAEGIIKIMSIEAQGHIKQAWEWNQSHRENL